MKNYQDIYPEAPLLGSNDIDSQRASHLLTLEYFEARPGEMPTQIFEQHHILINLREVPHRVENWRAGEHRDFQFHKNEIVITPAGVESGWRWHAPSKVIVITLEPEKFERFALHELGVLLNTEQLNNIPQFLDEDLTQAAEYLYKALEAKDLGYDVLFESLARVFLIKLIQKYGDIQTEAHQFKTGFTSAQFKQVFDHIRKHFGEGIALEELASVAGISVHHFSRLFKEVIGKSPMQYVQSYRIEEAKKLLSDPNLPLIEIAQRCGFSDQSHFSRVFKRSVGQSPKSFRT